MWPREYSCVPFELKKQPNPSRFPNTPRQLGYRMPAEWEAHAATWLAWPHSLDSWPESLREVEKSYLQMIEVLADGEKVKLLVDPEKEHERVQKLIRRRGCNLKNVELIDVPTIDVWIRDYGPTFLIKSETRPSTTLRTGGECSRTTRNRPARGGSASGGKQSQSTIHDPRANGAELAYIHWQYNAWGNKYQDLAEDRHVVDRLKSYLPEQKFEPGIVMEGGSIEVNGQGVCLTTEQCLLNPVFWVQ